MDIPADMKFWKFSWPAQEVPRSEGCLVTRRALFSRPAAFGPWFIWIQLTVEWQLVAQLQFCNLKMILAICWCPYSPTHVFWSNYYWQPGIDFLLVLSSVIREHRLPLSLRGHDLHRSSSMSCDTASSDSCTCSRSPVDVDITPLLAPSVGDYLKWPIISWNKSSVSLLDRRWFF